MLQKVLFWGLLLKVSLVVYSDMNYRNFYLQASDLANKIRSGEYQKVRQEKTSEQSPIISRRKKVELPQTKEDNYLDTVASYLAMFGDEGDMNEGTGGIGSDYVEVIPGSSPPPRRFENFEAKDVGFQLMSDLKKDFGLTTEQAAGIVGNLDWESGGFNTLQEIKPLVEGSRGGYGYAQWTGPRRVAFEEFAAANDLDPSDYSANYGFLKEEFTNSAEGKVLDRIREAGSAEEAAEIFSNTFLRPSKAHANLMARKGRANKYSRMFGEES